MNDLKFYLFNQRLLYKSQTKAKTVVLVNESYTTQTCSKCGFLHKKIGSNKEFICPSCEIKIDRDVNSAKNILMKGILSNVLRFYKED